MRRPYVLNVKLNEIQRREQNHYMVRKLGKAKPIVNSNCPESYNFYKNTFRKNNTNLNLSK